jgi:cytochrome d ubiquinol oxidase subunit II
MVLWLLILRGASIEFRNHVTGPLWAPFWDFMFCLSSGLLAIFFGAALGNVVRGVPLDAQGYFFEPLWTNLTFGKDAGILDWYTILVGFASYFALAVHGALWLSYKCEGEISVRARRVARICWWAVLCVTALVTLVTFRVQPHVLANLIEHPWGFIFPGIALIGLFGMFVFVRGEATLERERRAFFSSCSYLLGMLTSVVFGLYPYVLPARGGPELSLTIYNARTSERGMELGLAWWIIGMILAAIYFVYLYRRFAGKVSTSGEGSYH